MNYFAHGRAFVDDPYFLAGTAVPDWLNVSDRGVRVRSKHAAPHAAASDRRLAALAAGIVQHHGDDGWFHETRAFHEACWFLTRLVRDVLPQDEGFRPSFLGHILVEILLDAQLIAEQPERLEAYYRALEHVDAAFVQQAVNQMAPRPSERLAWLVPLFRDERFLWDYAQDDTLLFRLNQVMRRVKLPPLPESLADIFPKARRFVGQRRDELLRKPIAAVIQGPEGDRG
jgi:hypothetical protein